MQGVVKDSFLYEDVINETENIAAKELARQLRLIPDEDICKCRECLCDMICYALNNLPTTYRVSLLGAIYTSNDDALKEKVTGVVAEAIQVVSCKRKHA